MADPIVIAPQGELDVTATRDLNPQFSQAAGQRDVPVVFDLAGVTFLDSTVLGAVVQADVRLLRTGRRLLVVAPDGSPAARLLALSRMEGQLQLFGSREEALGAVGTQ